MNCRGHSDVLVVSQFSKNIVCIVIVEVITYMPTINVLKLGDRKNDVK